MYKVGFIGMGNMAMAIAKGIITSNFIPGQLVYAYDLDNHKLKAMYDDFQVVSCKSEIDLIEQVDLVVMAVKPVVLEGILIKIKDHLRNKGLISIVTGYDYNAYNQLLDGTTRHLTIMPNTPAMVSEGMTLFESEHSLNKDEFNFVSDMFTSIGQVVSLPYNYFASATSISGCGPAFVYMFIEAMADGAVLQGLPRDLAYKLASQVVIGSGKMVRETKLHPGSLKDAVCSPGGITIKGVAALENNSFRNGVIEAIKAASNK